MIRRSAVALSAIGLFATVSIAAAADEPSFADLLARAHTQVREGHQWEPPGDNATETFMALMKLLPQATPEQINDFAGLLQKQQQDLAVPSSPAIAAAGGSGPAVAGAPPTEAPPAAPASPDHPPSGTASADMPPAQPGSDQAPSDTQAPAQTTAERASPAPQTPEPPAAPADADHGTRDTTPEQSASAEPDVTHPAENPPPAANQSAALTPPAAAVPSASPPALSPSSEPPSPPGIGPAPSNGADTMPTRGTDNVHPAPAPSQTAEQAATPALPKAVVNDLFARGRSAEDHGNISGARRYYEVAARNGNIEAARALGRLYDPNWLHSRTLGGIDGDAAAARYWNERAAALASPATASIPQTMSEK